ncbi:MAG TPA: hypothetical protein V6C57_07195 [Coleofasciculaceae cyanobacterium]
MKILAIDLSFPVQDPDQHPLNHATIAPHQRDIRKAELEAQGFLCTTENLYTVNGDRAL